MQLELFDSQEKLIIPNQLTDKSPLIVSYGGGTNSTAMLIAMAYKNIMPNDILFADTQAELPETYEYLQIFNQWLSNYDMPSITTVVRHFSTDTKTGKQYNSIEEKCHLHKELPSKAYGKSSCSMTFKIEPMDRFIKSKYQDLIKDKIAIRRAIGYHAGELNRKLKSDNKDKIFLYEYPLIDWGLYQSHCNALIISAGLPLPPKSSCFFCPNRKPLEVLELRQNHPDLYQRGCDIENNAVTRSDSIKGLGRKFSWVNIGELTPIELELLSIKNRQCECIN